MSNMSFTQSVNKTNVKDSQRYCALDHPHWKDPHKSWQPDKYLETVAYNSGSFGVWSGHINCFYSYFIFSFSSGDWTTLIDHSSLWIALMPQTRQIGIWHCILWTIVRVVHLTHWWHDKDMIFDRQVFLHWSIEYIKNLIMHCYFSYFSFAQNDMRWYLISYHINDCVFVKYWCFSDVGMVGWGLLQEQTSCFHCMRHIYL